MCRNSSVIIATGLTVGVRLPEGEFFAFSTASIPALVSTQPPIQCAPRAVSLRVKQLGYEADHSLPSIAQNKNGGAIRPLPHTPSWISA
jgi:hypothetical protein